jgi:hypothetical protein
MITVTAGRPAGHHGILIDVFDRAQFREACERNHAKYFAYGYRSPAAVGRR